MSAHLELGEGQRRLPGVDYTAFAKEIYAAKARAAAELSTNDWHHLRKVIWVNRCFTLIGYATAWICPNPLSAWCISQGLFGRWMVMHHVSHGGYDKVPGIPRRYQSKVFAHGWRRFVDWFDWILPAAWHFEHDILHHCNTSEEKDPDLVEDHAEFLRRGGYPKWLRYVILGFTAMTWKFIYYAPNTLAALEQGQDYKPGMRGLRKIMWDGILDLRQSRVRKVWLLCYLPVLLFSFGIVPALFLTISVWAWFSVLCNRVLAELITNVHTFCVIAPNHAGDDLYRFDYHFKGKEEWCVNQVISSCNFRCGGDVNDYFHGWLNYQIEHHICPRFPMSSYQRMQPEFKEICERHNVPYVQQSVWLRVAQLFFIGVGNCSMKWLRASANVPLDLAGASGSESSVPLEPARRPGSGSGVPVDGTGKGPLETAAAATR